jgi:hypothetical protein
MRAVVEEAPRPTRLAGPLRPVLWGLLDKEPSRRWSVEQARTELRELLTGTLGPSRPAKLREGEADPTDTDPVAVIRPPMGPPPAIRSGAQVGGRAMLDPDEPLTGQLARLREEAGIPAESRGGRATTPHWHSAEPRPSAERRPSGEPRREHVGRRRARSSSAVLAEQVAGRVRALGREAGSAGKRSRLVVVAGLVGVLLLVGVAAWSGWFTDANQSPPPPDASGPASSGPATPLIDAQEYRERGIAVNVPKAWTRSGAGSYVDFTDPTSARWVRINIEPTTATAMQFLRNAETGLRNPSRCAAPFTEVGLREATLGGQPGAELEYTCGTADTKRHGIWRAVVVNGTAYHFYLTVPDPRFAESKIIFDEMVRSFQFV